MTASHGDHVALEAFANPQSRIETARGARSVNTGIVPRTGTTLLRAWRGRTHTVMVREDGFEYEGQRYRSLTIIAERITGAHWSGPRFVGLTKSGCTSLSAETSQ